MIIYTHNWYTRINKWSCTGYTYSNVENSLFFLPVFDREMQQMLDYQLAKVGLPLCTLCHLCCGNFISFFFIFWECGNMPYHSTISSNTTRGSSLTLLYPSSRGGTQRWLFYFMVQPQKMKPRGGEQQYNVFSQLKIETDSERIRFFCHILCRRSVMFGFLLDTNT